MKSRRSGFTLVAALCVGALLGAASLTILSMKKSIDDETRNVAIKHAQALAEDIVKTQVAIKTKEIQKRLELGNFIESFVNNPGVAEGFKIPILGTECNDAKEPCYVRVLRALQPQTDPPKTEEERKILDLSAYLADESHLSIALVLGVSIEDSEHLQFKMNSFDLRIDLPTQATIEKKEDQVASDMECFKKGTPNAQLPLFKGTKTKAGSPNALEADCREIVVDSTKASREIAGETLTVACDVSKGYWLSAIQSDLQPKCLAFPEGVGPLLDDAVVPVTNVRFCENDNEVAKSYELNSDFTVNKLKTKCVRKGGPYEFMEQKRRWGDN